MKVSKYNHEGYHDPTAHEALSMVLTEIGQPNFRPLVYICSPFAGDVEHNIQRARQFSRFAASRGAIPIAPHLLFPQFMDDTDPDERALGLFMGMVLLTKCKELWQFGGRISEGMQMELDKALLRGIPVRRFDERCVEVIDDE